MFKRRKSAEEIDLKNLDSDEQRTVKRYIGKPTLNRRERRYMARRMDYYAEGRNKKSAKHGYKKTIM